MFNQRVMGLSHVEPLVEAATIVPGSWIELSEAVRNQRSESHSGQLTGKGYEALHKSA